MQQNDQEDQQGLPPEQNDGAGQEQQAQSEQQVSQESSSATVVDQGVQDKTVQEPQVEQPAPVVESAAPQVVTPAKTAPVVTQKQPADAMGFEALIAKVKAEGTVEQKRMIAGIEQYMERMAPGLGLDFNDGARHQHTFWKLIQGVIERAPQDQFGKMWSILLGYFEQYKDGVFSDRYVFRFAEFWTQSEAELAAYQRILNVIKLTSNPNDRAKGLRQVDLSRSLEQVFTEQGRQRVVSFYQK